MSVNPYNFDGANADVRDLLPERIRDAYDHAFEFIAVYDSDSEWSANVNLSPMHKKIRLGIWREIARIHISRVKKFNVRRALDGCCKVPNFYAMLRNHQLAGYLFTKPVDHQLEARILLDDSFENLRNILKLPQMTELGKVNTAVLASQIKIHKMLEDRVMGQTVQRIQQHTVQEVSHKTKKLQTIDEIDAELKKLESSSDEPQGFLDASEVEIDESFETEE